MLTSMKTVRKKTNHHLSMFKTVFETILLYFEIAVNELLYIPCLQFSLS